ncbi:hypothetical protein LN249_01105 [Vibrio alginolyticus]|nr:hypothetical protein LN249_01105 [Vibrio alginolyticus]
MKINEFMIAFQTMETRNNLFNVEYNGENVWDIVRYNVFQALQEQYEPIATKNFLKKAIKSSLSLVSKLIFLTKIKFKKNDILFCKTSRTLSNRNYVDEYSKPVLDRIEKKRVAEIELYHLADSNANARFLFNYSSKKHLPETIVESFLKAINESFHSLCQEEIIISAMQEAYSKYLSERRFYDLLFRCSGIKKVFLVQNGIQKGLISAAKSRGVKVTEIQHGYVGFTHPVYSYPGLTNSHSVYLPKEFWVFSEFWTKEINMPGTQFKIIGHELKDVTLASNDTILFISRNNHHEVLKDYLYKLDQEVGRKIIYKLHPNQFSDSDLIKNEFSNCKNVKVITDEVALSDCIKESSDIVCIQSTVVYEALQSNRKVICIKECDFIQSSTLEKIENYYVVEDERSMIDIINNNETQELKVQFFDVINDELVSKI